MSQPDRKNIWSDSAKTVQKMLKAVKYSSLFPTVIKSNGMIVVEIHFCRRLFTFFFKASAFLSKSHDKINEAQHFTPQSNRGMIFNCGKFKTLISNA